MLVIAGHIDIDPAKRGDAVEAANKMMEETHKEPGCIAYSFSADFSNPGRFRLFEEWESQAALDAHFVAPHMAEFQQAMGGFGVTAMSVHKYAVTDKGPVR